MKNFSSYLKLPVFIFILFGFTDCSNKQITKTTNIVYRKSSDLQKENDHHLNIYSPGTQGNLKEVFIFLHGGGWNKGKKSTYAFLGKRMAKKGVVSVIMDYPLSPKANYNDMAIASATAVKWIKENISKYGGNPEKIFISGHSAGGHLAALINVKKKYFDSLGIENPIKGVILIDAAGLDMHKYLTDQEANGGKHYLEAFTKDHINWKDASPVYHVHKEVPPMLIFTGGKTYPNIKSSNERFAAELLKNNVTYTYKVLKRKRHIPMIFQLYNSNNAMYEDIIAFMKQQK